MTPADAQRPTTDNPSLQTVLQILSNATTKKIKDIKMVIAGEPGQTPRPLQFTVALSGPAFRRLQKECFNTNVEIALSKFTVTINQWADVTVFDISQCGGVLHMDLAMDITAEFNEAVITGIVTTDMLVNKFNDEIRTLSRATDLIVENSNKISGELEMERARAEKLMRSLKKSGLFKTTAGKKFLESLK
jgi:hypothetical protein